MTTLSRLEKFGTIFTRVRDLMRAGVMKETDKPLWHDVMAAFPPRDEPTYNRDYQKDLLPEILYKEDAVRAQFYKVYGSNPSIDLTKPDNVNLSPCHRFITKYQELERNDTRPPAELFEATAAALAQEGLVLRKQSERRPPRRKTEESSSGPAVKGLALLLQQALEDPKRPSSTPDQASSSSGEDAKEER